MIVQLAEILVGGYDAQVKRANSTLKLLPQIHPLGLDGLLHEVPVPHEACRGVVSHEKRRIAKQGPRCRCSHGSWGERWGRADIARTRPRGTQRSWLRRSNRHTTHETTSIGTSAVLAWFNRCCSKAGGRGAYNDIAALTEA